MLDFDVFKRLAVATVIALCATTADAKRIYSYRDANGVVHFSDRPPQDAAGEVKEQLVEVDPKKLVYLREEGPDNDRRYSLWNGYGGPIEVLVSFKRASNVISEPQLPASVVIPGQRQSLVLMVQPIDEHQGWSYEWSYQYIPGDPKAQPDPNAVYRLPYDEQLALPVHQGFGGEFSHKESHSFHAVDFGMDEGTPVLAARAGVVMSVESDFHAAGTDLSRYGDRANHIRILHSDGTMGVYAHLALESVLVSIGDRVRAGEHIANSGNTGFSTGPHLHFVVQRNAGGALVSVPFQFTIDGQKITPTSGAVLGARVSAGMSP